MPLLPLPAPTLKIPMLEQLSSFSLDSLISLTRWKQKGSKGSRWQYDEDCLRFVRETVLSHFKTITDKEARLLQFMWTFWARPEQLLPSHDSWNIWLAMAGRGWGKTRTGAESVRHLIENCGYHRVGLIADTAADVRDVMIEGPAGILDVCPPWNKPKYYPSIKKLVWPNGAIAQGYSAEDPESLRGPQFDLAWGDELAKWRYADKAFDMLQFGMRLGRRPIQLYTTTPRPIPLVRQLLKMKGTALSHGRTTDNIFNLAPTFRETVIARYEGTRLGRQELEAEVLDDNPDALWALDNLDKYRLEKAPDDLERTVIGVDPPATESGRCGIIAAAKKGDHAFILGDYSVDGRKPEDWAKAVSTAYHMHMADLVVAEINQGGDMVSSILKSYDQELPVRQVRAFKGKWLRAEPVAGLYQQGRVHHIGYLPELEDQMVQLTPENMARGKSPDDLDAMVYAVTDLLLTKHATPRIR